MSNAIQNGVTTALAAVGSAPVPGWVAPDPFPPGSLVELLSPEEVVGTQEVDPSGIASGEAWGTAQVNMQVQGTGIASAEAFGTAAIQKSCLENTAEGGSNGTAVTTGNSGGSSGDAWDAVTIAGSSAITFSSTHAHPGSLSTKYSRNGGSCLTKWDASWIDKDGTYNIRFYLWIDANPSAQVSLVIVRNNGATQDSRVNLLATGKLQLVDTTGLIGAQSTALPTGQWVRIEAQFDTVGNTGELRYFANADSSVATDTIAPAGTWLNDIAAVEFGIQGAATFDAFFDSIKVCDQGWIGSVNQEVDPSGIASSEAWGTAQVNLQVQATGIASGEAWGTAKVNLTVGGTGIASSEAWGTATVSGGTVTVSPTGITSNEAWGTAQINLKVSPTGIASGEAWGTATVSVAIITITGTGIPSAEAFGTAQVNLQVPVFGIASGEAWGTAFVSPGAPAQAVGAIGILSSEAWGEPKVLGGRRYEGYVVNRGSMGIAGRAFSSPSSYHR